MSKKKKVSYSAESILASLVFSWVSNTQGHSSHVKSESKRSGIMSSGRVFLVVTEQKDTLEAKKQMTRNTIPERRPRTQVGLSSHSLWPVGLGLQQMIAWNLNIRGNQKARVPDLSEMPKLKQRFVVLGRKYAGQITRGDSEKTAETGIRK